jgi:hypothetical protein
MKTSEDAGALKWHCVCAVKAPAAEEASAARETPVLFRDPYRRFK